MFWSVSAQTIPCDKESNNRLDSEPADECGELKLQSVIIHLQCLRLRFIQLSAPGRRGEGGTPRKIGRGCTGPVPKTLLLFMTKNCIFLYPIYDLTERLIPYLWPLLACGWHICLKCNLWRVAQSPDGRIDNVEKAASSKKHIPVKVIVQKPFPI